MLQRRKGPQDVRDRARVALADALGRRVEQRLKPPVAQKTVALRSRPLQVARDAMQCGGDVDRVHVLRIDDSELEDGVGVAALYELIIYRTAF